MMPYILVGVLSFLVALALGLFLGYRYRKNAAEKEIGSIAPGKWADFVVCDENFGLTSVYIDGKLIQ